ncbi:hypothetical protein [Janibacter hoylei]|nr:hypothetical protein [Janibacter hoylei]MCT1619057.1 hypothetical protein [Janibacter hoylei]MCT2293845.1 hypothetical protein [Janibacter hoylei]
MSAPSAARKPAAPSSARKATAATYHAGWMRGGVEVADRAIEASLL